MKPRRLTNAIKTAWKRSGRRMVGVSLKQFARADNNTMGRDWLRNKRQLPGYR